MRIKICGLREPAAIEAAVDAGVNAIGFVFADSVRRIEPGEAAELRQALPPFVSCVAVFKHPSAELVAQVVREVRPDWLQTDLGDIAEQPAQGVPWLPVLREGVAQRQLPAAFLYEGAQSGQGKTVDWTQAARLAKRGRLILAGGLAPDNVGEAIGKVRPYGVDVSSGVELARGIKDVARIQAFVRAVRDAEFKNGVTT